MAFWKRLLLMLPWRRRAAERDMQEELQSIAAMAGPRELGNLTRAAEDARAEWGWLWIGRVVQDIRHAVRGFRTGRGSTVLAFGILTFTLAAGTVTFSVVDALLLRPLPYGDPEGLVAVARQARPDEGPGAVSTQDYLAWRDSTRSFAMLGAAVPTGVLRLETGGDELLLARVTPNLFDVLRVRPALGRFFRPEDETPGHDAVIVLAHSAWVRLFHADPRIVGRRVTFTQSAAASAYEVVGVLPPGVTFPVASTRPYEVFRPYVPSDRDRNYGLPARAFNVHLIGRLHTGVTRAEAEADVARSTAAVRASYGMTGRQGWSAVVLPLHDFVVGRAKSWLLLVLAAVGCVVLVGCVNAASLLLARATVRARELATRAALGASRGRLARTLLAEGVLLALASSAAAIALSYWAVEIAKSSLPEGLARASTIALDIRVLTASIAAAIVCGLLTGGMPAWRVARTDLFEQLRIGGGVIGGRRQARSLGVFLVAEVAFVSVLLVATTLLVASFVAVTTTDLGFDRRNVAAIPLSRPLPSVPKEERQAIAAAFFDDVIRRAAAVPGVTGAALIGSSSAPLSGGSARYSVEIAGVGEVSGADMFETRGVSPKYFEVMGVSLLRGRPFTDEDRFGAPQVAIINDLAARRYFAGRDPVGEIIRFREAPTRIVGIAQNVRLNGPEGDLRNEIYMPLAQAKDPQVFPRTFTELVVRTSGSAPSAATDVREAIRPALAGEPVPEPRFINDAFRRLTAARRFNAGLMSVFGALALVIGAIGIYGTMAFAVAQQARAIGLRMALGASQTDVLQSVLRESLWRVGLGTALGLVAARSAAGLFTSLVFGVTPTSPAVYAGVALGLASMAVLAALIPARRAARLDPLSALRAE